MNIFFIHHNIKKCAKYHSDKHVVKMILEMVQLLTCAQYFNYGGKPYKKAYKQTHINHPLSIWMRESYQNYLYTIELAEELCKEFRYRRNNIHACEYHLKRLKKLKSFENRKIDWGDKIRLSMKKGCKYNITLIPMCMPIIFAKYDCAIKCYRRYYRSKKEINKWEWKNNKPAWY